jgi:hypothetical protein
VTAAPKFTPGPVKARNLQNAAALAGVYKQQRDELREVLRQMLADRDEHGCSDYPSITRARAVLAKVGAQG